MIGSFARDSAKMNSRMPTMPARIRPPTDGSVHWWSCLVASSTRPLLVSPMRSKAIDIVKITPPRTSKLRVARAVLTVGSSRWMTTSETIPIGMLT